MRVVEAEELSCRTARDSADDQLTSVTEQYQQARQHVTLLEASRRRCTCQQCVCLFLVVANVG